MYNEPARPGSNKQPFRCRLECGVESEELHITLFFEGFSPGYLSVNLHTAPFHARALPLHVLVSLRVLYVYHQVTPFKASALPLPSRVLDHDIFVTSVDAYLFFTARFHSNTTRYFKYHHLYLDLTYFWLLIHNSSAGT